MSIKGHILLIDSDLNTLLTRQRVLSAEMDEEGSLTIAGTTERALTFIQKTDYSLIVCNLDMPKLNPLKFLSQVKQARPKSRILFLAGSDAHRESLVRHGADDVIDHPATTTEFVRAIQRALRRMDLIRRVREANLRKRT
jgi:CheY-like chemotaxis protein